MKYLFQFAAENAIYTLFTVATQILKIPPLCYSQLNNLFNKGVNKMELLKKLAYMGVGALVVLLVVFAVAGSFAQEDDSAAPATEADTAVATTFRGRAALAHPGTERPERDTLLAEALGISAEELEAAREEVRLAGIDAALEQELITEAQAEMLRERAGRLPGRMPFPVAEFEFDAEAVLADTLDISVEELAAAREEARALALEAQVEAGRITEEEAELMVARQAVRDYFDRDAVIDLMEQLYGDAVQQALDAGEITEAQAELLLENPPAYERFDQGGRRPGGHGRGDRHGGPAGFSPPASQAAPAGPGV